jgi:hypothetical protein
MIPSNYHLRTFNNHFAISNRTSLISNSIFCDCPYQRLKTDIKLLKNRISFIVYLIIFKFFML